MLLGPTWVEESSAGDDSTRLRTRCSGKTRLGQRKRWTQGRGSFTRQGAVPTQLGIGHGNMCDNPEADRECRVVRRR